MPHSARKKILAYEKILTFSFFVKFVENNFCLIFVRYEKVTWEVTLCLPNAAKM